MVDEYPEPIDDSTPVFAEAWGVEYHMSNGEIGYVSCHTEDWARTLCNEDPGAYPKLVRRYVTEWEEVE